MAHLRDLVGPVQKLLDEWRKPLKKSRRYKRTWQRGDKAKVAFHAGISPQYLCDLMADRKECSVHLARILETAAIVCGYRIPKEMWAFPERRKSSLLFPPYTLKRKYLRFGA